MGNNFTLLLDKYPVTPYLDCRDSFIRWVHFIHNKINIAIKKNTITLSESLEQYHELDPQDIVIKKFYFDMNIDMVSLNKNTGPTSWSIVGSNTGIDGSWVQLSSQNVTSDLWHLKTVPIVFYLLTVPTIGYSYYRIIILIAGTQYSYVGIKQFNLII